MMSRSGHYVQSTTLHVTASAQSSLAIYTLRGLRLATASISSFLAITWRQWSFLPWLQRSNTRLSWLYVSFLFSSFSHLRICTGLGVRKFIPTIGKAVAGRREAVHASGWVDHAYTDGRKLSPRLPVLLQNHKDMPKILQPFFWHYYLSFHFPHPQANPVT